jgi:hypothetical protein
MSERQTDILIGSVDESPSILSTPCCRCANRCDTQGIRSWWSSSCAPYIKYIYARNTIPSIPSYCTEPGQSLVEKVFTCRWLPRNLTGITYDDSCIDNEENLDRLEVIRVCFCHRHIKRLEGEAYSWIGHVESW